MADVFAVFGILILLAIVFPGLLTTYWLLFPTLVDRARVRLQRTPRLTFLFGLPVTGVALLPAIVLIALPFGPAKFAGWMLIFILVAIFALGAAGLVAVMAARLAGHSSDRLSDVGAYVRAAIALEFALGFPIIGWFILIPLLIVLSAGATVFAALGWLPKEKPARRPAAAPADLGQPEVA